MPLARNGLAISPKMIKRVFFVGCRYGVCEKIVMHFAQVGRASCRIRIWQRMGGGIVGDA